MSESRRAKTPRVAIIGAGFGGLGMAYYLKQAGIESFTIFEKAAELGGTWRENTYPGCGCDVPSHLYSFSFEPHYPWAWRYARQHEILAYAHHCADKYGLDPHIRLNCEVSGAEFDAGRGVWVVSLAGGERHEAEFLVSAVGQLHHPAYPNIPGMDRFQGKAFHSAHWDHDYELDGKSVAVVGTGASAVQFVPEIAPVVRQLHVFQRTPGWTIKKVEREFSPLERKLLDRMPLIHDLDRKRIFMITELLSRAYEGNQLLERIVTAMAKRHLEQQVPDPELRARLTPDYPIGCKRILLSNDWLPALCRSNVEVVTDAIEEITEAGLRTSDGRLREVDAIIYGTGFKATDFLAPMEVRGLDGASLRETWRKAASAFLGMSVSGFPNFFVLYGPNTNVGSGSILFMLECQQRYIRQLIEAQRHQGWRYADLRPEVQADFAEEMRRRSDETTFKGDCQSWYKTADGVNTNNWVGLMEEFGRRTAAVDFSRYELVGGDPTVAPAKP